MMTGTMTLNFHQPILDEAQTHQMLRDAILTNKPFMGTRIGGVEFSCLVRYLKIKDRWWKYFPLGIQSQMKNNAGVINANSKILEKVSRRYLSDLEAVDIMGIWEKPEEPAIFSNYCPQAKLTHLRFFDPIITTIDPSWTYALAGKKVVIIHPFEDTIFSQYSKREHLFPGLKILPKFELITLKAVQSIASEPTPFLSWFEALQSMEDQLTQLDFDVVLIAAGAYGLPLAAHAKRLGKTAIHIGGCLQLLFGIIGQRWLMHSPKVSALMNAYWTTPSYDETPKKYQKVEGGTYWG